MTSLFLASTLPILFSHLLLVDKLRLVIFDIFQIHFPNLGVAVVLFEFERGLRNRFRYLLAVTSWCSTFGVRDRDQEVRSRLPVGWFVAHVDKVFARKIGRPKVDHPAFVNEADLVEQIGKRFAGLVYGYDRGVSRQVGSDT